MKPNRAVRAILPAVLILAAGGGSAWWMVKHKKVAETQEPEETVVRAQFVRVERQDFQVTLETSGEVTPRTMSTLIPQVAGEVLEVSPNFRSGGFFEAGELLLALDERDYVAAVTEAAATLAQAQATHKLEEARSAQAIASWDDLGKGGEPSELTMRIPQLAEAQAAAEAADARLALRRDLERTKIVAPYAGYVRQKAVDLGQYVSPGTQMGEIFAIDYVEIRLPIDPGDLEFITLPEHYRAGSGAGSPQPKVLLRDADARETTWEGRVVRAEGEFDARSRRLFVIAQVDDPYALHSPGKAPLKIGQFVNAEIEGEQLKDVFVIPEQAVRFGTEIKVIDDENRIRFRQVDVIWTDLPHVVVRTGLEPGERLCLTALPFATEGAPVEPYEFGGEPPPQKPLAAPPEPVPPETSASS